ncbi:M48 family metalloprotease [Leptolyngbya sp. FACHB-36]|uniref:M48 family metalloprotease n=1 Tax=Leptolyngbya sp. FACHB-36 TaxID=2692808 RepID=UPI001681C045|nr:M48 family metalloprotease [Leptolyngbya sp. FACHB-36]MBD2019749.1 M48 family metalloprotease [Leptolyngbya sp. FACHB-36]
MKRLTIRFTKAFTRAVSLSLVVLLTFTSIVLTQTRAPAVEPTPAPSPTASPAAPSVTVPTIDAPTPTASPGSAEPAKPTPTSTSQPASAEPAKPTPTPTGEPSAEPAKPTPTPASPPTDTKPTDATETPADAAPKPDDKPAKSPEELERTKKLAEADRLYQQGDAAAAEKLYRQIKSPFSDTAAPETRPKAITDPEQLSPGGRVYWREYQEGARQNLETRIFVPLNLLVEKHPEFVPGHVKLAASLEERGKLDEAASVLDRASGLYPNQPDLLRARMALLAKREQWIEASIAARQFALLHPDDPAAPEFAALAEENLKRYQRSLRSKLTGNLIGNILTGAIGYAVTGNLFGPLSAVQTTVLMLRGESAVGERFARQAERQLDLVKDEATLKYVDDLGQKLAKAAGRNEFNYQFYVVEDDKLNAFALPGGKVFINAGAIVKSNSEAELAGLLGHELAHAVLSHGFQLVTESSLTANVFQFIPLGGLINDLVVLNYSRDMERQADILGTRLLAASGYAADGLRNLMATLGKEDKRATIDFLSSHPVTTERVKYLETLIDQSGYNRYAYEGINRHAEIQEQVKKILQAKKERDEKDEGKRRDERRNEN